MLNFIENKLDNISVTENGAIGYKSTGSALVDLNYKVSSLRNSDEEEIISLFDKAFFEDEKYTLKWLFFSRDIREGLGERRLFRICYRRLAELNFLLFAKNLMNISEYGRWDDLVSLLGMKDMIDEIIMRIIRAQLASDETHCDNGEPISLLAKWLPSENASSKKTKALGKKVRRYLNMSPREYRLLLSKLRKHLDVVEVKLCGNKWSEVDYEKVPSLANLKYNRAFFKHDEDRRIMYLNSVENGDKKMNMSVSTPVDIVSKYTMGLRGVRDYDKGLELAWKNLKDIQIKDTLVVADGSGSMTVPVSGKTTALDVARALAIYTSEHNNDVYKNKYITFSSHPQFVKFNEENTLRDKLLISVKHCEIANTNIEAVFDLILDVAIENDLSQDEMIKNILIISDMEFDMAVSGRFTQSLFSVIEEKYAKYGYKLPKLIFWNVNSRTKTIPLIENDLGVVLVSGFSQNVLKMVMSSKYDPYEVLIETLDGPRYDKIIVE